MKHQIIVLGAALALGLAGCESAGGGGDKMAAKGTPLDAAGLAKEFQKGSKKCSWTKPDGSKGEDFYFKTAGPYSGDADRNVDKKTMRGRWKIVGQGFYTNFGKGKKALGDWHRVHKIEKNTYDLIKSDGTKAMTMKCT